MISAAAIGIVMIPMERRKTYQGEEQSCSDVLFRLGRSPLLLVGVKLQKVGRESGRDHRRGERHRRGDGEGVRQEWRQGHHRRYRGRRRPRHGRRARAGRRVHALRRHGRGCRRGRRPRHGAPRPPRRRLQQRRHPGRRGPGHARRARPRLLRPRHGRQRPVHGGVPQARGARHGAAPQRLHPLHGELHGVDRRPGGAGVLHLEGGRRRHGANGGEAAGARRRAGERHLAAHHPDGDARHLRDVPGSHRRGGEEDGDEGHAGDGRDVAGGGRRGEGGRLPGVRRGQVRHRPQPRRRRRLHGGQGPPPEPTGLCLTS